MKNKHAQISTIQVLIIALVFLFLASSFLYARYFPSLKEGTRLANCKTSVEANSRMRISGIDFSRNINCPTKDLVIKEKDQEKIKQIIAKDMVETWSIFDEGKRELFSDEGILCMINSRIDFKDKEEEITGFSKYLSETKMQNSDKTYLEYLAKYETQDAQKVLGDQTIKNYNFQGDSFSTDTTKAVIFVYAKGKDSVEKLGNILLARTLAGEIGTTVAGYSAVAGGIGAGLAIFGLVSNPIGWTIAAAGGIISVGSLISAYFLDPNNVPEWTAIVMFTEYTAETLDELGCEYLPVGQSFNQ